MDKKVEECQWISLYKTTNCSKKLAKKGGPFCSYHRYLINKVGENHICSVCGVGVKSKTNLCIKHGVEMRNEKMLFYRDRKAIFDKEWNRLKKIKCF